MKKVLVVEDQEMPWMMFKAALKACGIPPETVVRARCYSEAEEKIQSEKYDLIFLDHRMPMDDPGFTDSLDLKAFSGYLQEIGYGLLPLIATHQPQAVVVGTSSLSASERGSFGTPPHYISKLDLFDELPPLLQSLFPTT